MSIGSNSKNFSKLCLIGMSGVGKSFWAERFKSIGYTSVSCDQLICEEIIKKIEGYDNIINCLGTWLGFPWEEGFAERESKYLNLENKFMAEFAKSPYSSPTLLDSTGSLIYCSKETIEELEKEFILVYLKSSAQQVRDLIQNYCKSPRPILWNKTFPSEIKNPTPRQLEENLTKLINQRQKLYQAISDVTITSAELATSENVEELLKLIKNKYEQRS